uniref:Uncharacterized protein n=1 Tax=Rhizophora mucronata TaxID=61149 RepID=A0A2P2NTS7_RHIMU
MLREHAAKENRGVLGSNIFLHPIGPRPCNSPISHMTFDFIIFCDPIIE